MFVTTAGRTNQEMIKKAIEIAVKLGAEFLPRNKRSIQALTTKKNGPCLVVGKDRLELFEKTAASLSFFILIRPCFG